MNENKKTDNGIDDKKQAVKSRRFKLGKYFVIAFAVSLGLLIVSYGSFAYAYRDKSLPLLRMNGVDVGKLKKGEIIATLKKISESKNESKVKIEFEGESIEKTYTELGITMDYGKSPEKILDFGKIKGILPSPAYLNRTVHGDIIVAPVGLWVEDTQKKFLELFPSKKEDAQNPNLALADEDVKIEPEKKGYVINVNNLQNEIEKHFLYGSDEKITAQKSVLKSNVTKSDIEPFLDQIKTIADSDIAIRYSTRRTYLDREKIISFIDVERTVLEQKIVLSDAQVNTYMDELSSKINSRARPRQISTYDGAILSEGREGIKVDSEKSRPLIENAILNNENSVSLEVTTAEIQDEYVEPGFTPGKYPGRYIEVNLSEQNLYQWEGSTLVATHKVSTGKWSMPTPTGEFSINNKDPRAYSREYGLYMPYWMSFIGSQYGIHELPEWPDGTKEGEGHLGTPVSHGCIRLGRGSAEAVYNWVDIGTPVYVHK